MKNFSTRKPLKMSGTKERTTGNPKSTIGAKAAQKNKANTKKTSKKMGY